MVQFQAQMYATSLDRLFNQGHGPPLSVTESPQPFSIAMKYLLDNVFK